MSMVRAGLVKSGAGSRSLLMQIMHWGFTVVCASAAGLSCFWLVPCVSQGSNPFTGCFAAVEQVASLWPALTWPRGVCAGPCAPDLHADNISLAAVQMLTKDPAARVGLAAVMGHPWVTSGGQDPLQSMEQAGQVVRGGSALTPPRRGCTAVLVHLALCQEPLHSMEQAEQGARDCNSSVCSAWRHASLQQCFWPVQCWAVSCWRSWMSPAPSSGWCGSGRQQGKQSPSELASPQVHRTALACLHLHVTHGMQGVGGPRL